jgi:hypothetical protein
VSAQLGTVDGAGKIPTWLTVNGKFLNGIGYATGLCLFVFHTSGKTGSGEIVFFHK